MKTLSLLPPEIREEIELSKKNAKLRQYFYFSVMTATCLMVVYMVAIFFLYTQKTELERQKVLAKDQISSQETSFAKAKDLSSRIDLIKKIIKNSINWNLLFSEVAKQTPQNVQIDTFVTKKNDPRVKVNGTALTDKDAVAFKENLAKSEMFEYVDIESILQGKDKDNRPVKVFVMSFSLKMDKVKQ